MTAHTLIASGQSAPGQSALGQSAPGHSPFEQPPAGRRASRLPAALRGRAADPAWVRPSVLVLVLATALLYLWGLGASGYANSFYSAAAQAGSASWKALFFGSSDAANSITVDKPPAALWIMALSVRIFGLNSWSQLVPQALEGVASVALLYLTVRRTSGPTAGLIAGAVLATSPMAALRRAVQRAAARRIRTAERRTGRRLRSGSAPGRHNRGAATAPRAGGVGGLLNASTPRRRWSTR